MQGAGDRRRRNGTRDVTRLGARLLVLGLLVLATPGVADVIEELVAHALGVACCEDSRCCEDTGEGCPNACVACACCVQPSALVTVAHVPSPAERPSASRFVGYAARPCAPGYRTPPFRPPAV